MSMKLFFSPGACSLGIHIILEEIGKPYETQRVKLQEGEQYGPEYTAITPKSKVPCLARDDGSVLTEYGAIATWLAKSNPDANLLPHDVEAECRALEAMDYGVATVHMQGFARIARPLNFAPDADDTMKEKVQARGREIFAKGLKLLADKLGDSPWVAGSQYSIGDTAVFYVASWSQRAGVDRPHAIQAHFDRMKERPAVQRMIAAEGLSL
jgi:glutathione S-transferase